MKNVEFKSLTQAEKATKMGRAIKKKSQGLIPDTDIRIITASLSLDEQYRISVIHDKDKLKPFSKNEGEVTIQKQVKEIVPNVWLVVTNKLGSLDLTEEEKINEILIFIEEQHVSK